MGHRLTSGTTVTPSVTLLLIIRRLQPCFQNAVWFSSQPLPQLLQVGLTVTPLKSDVASTVLFGTSPGNYTGMAHGFSTTYTQNYSLSTGNMLSYTSGLIHHVWVMGELQSESPPFPPHSTWVCMQ